MSENLNVFISGDENIYGIYFKGVNFLPILLFLRQIVSDITTDITKQNVNVMMSMFSIYYKKH